MAICVGNLPVAGEFPAQRPVTRSLMFSAIYALINCWENNREAGDLRRYRAHYDVTVIFMEQNWQNLLGIPVSLLLSGWTSNRELYKVCFSNSDCNYN